MFSLEYDIVLYNSLSYESLVSKFYRICRYKRNIYKKIRNEEEFCKKLSNEEKIILKSLSEKENRTLLEILANKQWLVMKNIIMFLKINSNIARKRLSSSTMLIMKRNYNKILRIYEFESQRTNLIKA